MRPENPTDVLLRLALSGGGGVFVGVLVLGYLEGAVDVSTALGFGAVAAVSFPLAEWLSWTSESRLVQGLLFGLTVGLAMAVGSTVLGLAPLPFGPALVAFGLGGIIAGLLWKSKTLEQRRAG
ncbi:MAG: hypothetical protein GVY15_02125 [Bacteroidetes bacterium]|jgi:putative flippase GtrA|nr:hypothetical protein [Bacteroidota bacterium]